MSENICKDKCPHYESYPQVGYQQECQIWWDIQRLAAVRELTKIAVDPMARLHDIEKTVQALRAVWPEAVEE